MTDNEIKNVLECCADQNADLCAYCPMRPEHWCIEQMCSEALDLINRLETDKEALIAGQESLQQNLPKVIKSEAIRDCADRFETAILPTVSALFIIGEILVDVSKSHISAEKAIDDIRKALRNTICSKFRLQQTKDDLIKEMMGENNG